MKKNRNTDRPLLFKIVMLASGLIIGFILMKALFLTLRIDSESMNPAISSGDIVLISRFASIKTGDIIAFDSPSEEGRLIVSRIIASENDTVEIRNKTLLVNGNRKEIVSDSTRNSSIIFPMKFCFRDNMPPVRVGRNEYFVLADNFDRGFDSRTFGKISGDSVAGRIVYKK